MKKLEQVVFEELGKSDITPLNPEWKKISIISNAIEKWIFDNFADTLQKWLVEDYEPARRHFEYDMYKEFPNTFNKYIHNEPSNNIDENIEEAEYEEIYTNN